LLDSKDAQIIFIGHSLGGLIIREALQYMKWIKNNLFAMITLNTPHMGCLGDKFLVNTGRLSLFIKSKELKY
jgi:triacylglycerol esterase/lipase EstA (alpha/beta hydrolase family)